MTRAALGTQNHTLLTVEALTHRDVPIRGLVVGAWPHRPGPVEALNGEFFEALDVPLIGRIPEGSGGWDSTRFRREAPRWFVRISEHRGAPTTDR